MLAKFGQIFAWTMGSLEGRRSEVTSRSETEEMSQYFLLLALYGCSSYIDFSLNCIVRLGFLPCGIQVAFRGGKPVAAESLFPTCGACLVF